MRFFYNLFAYLLLLPYTVYWLTRALFNRRYRPKLAQRFGFSYPRLENCIWIHAVSVGEVVAAAPLVRELRQRYPERDFLVSTVTPTGAERAAALFGDSVTHCFIPFEMPYAVDNFFSSVKPAIALIMETEIWPNLYRGCGIRGIPLVLVSARISPRSVGSYRRFLPLFRDTLSHGIVIAAQSEADAARFVELGASPDRTRVTGNIKFDMQLPDREVERGAEFRAQHFSDRPVWIAASTHDGEEAIIIDAHVALRELFPELLLILVPRHPERFSVVKDLLSERAVATVARTDARACGAETAVFLGDTMGEMTLFYAASDVALVAGSLAPIGGHNLLEPAALGLPILTGPHVFNAQEIADRFEAEDALRYVTTADDIVMSITMLLQHPDKARYLGANGKQLLESSRGALARLLEQVVPLID